MLIFGGVATFSPGFSTRFTGFSCRPRKCWGNPFTGGDSSLVDDQLVNVRSVKGAGTPCLGDEN